LIALRGTRLGIAALTSSHDAFFLIIVVFCLYLLLFIETSERSAHAQGGSSDP
jgi:hypothetical protein